jgi:hypothetical protein
LIKARHAPFRQFRDVTAENTSPLLPFEGISPAPPDGKDLEDWNEGESEGETQAYDENGDPPESSLPHGANPKPKRKKKRT